MESEGLGETWGGKAVGRADSRSDKRRGPEGDTPASQGSRDRADDTGDLTLSPDADADIAVQQHRTGGTPAGGDSEVPELELPYQSHQRYLKEHVLPAVDEAITALLAEVKKAEETGADAPYDGVGWLAYRLRTGQTPPRKRVIRFKDSLPLRAHLTPAVLSDSYKAGHFAQYPDSRRMCAYGEFRHRMGGLEDDRIVVFGVRYVVEQYLNTRWTHDDIENAALFYATHNAGFTPYPFPVDLFHRFVDEYDGYFPVRVDALLDGTVVHARTPVYQITAAGDYARLCTFLETLLTHVWYPCTVATLGRRLRSALERAFEESADPAAMALVETRIIDYGMRECSTVDQAVAGGCAHLLNFSATSNAPAAYFAQHYLNRGKPAGTAVPTADEDPMLAWPQCREAVMRMVETFGSGAFCCVLNTQPLPEGDELQALLSEAAAAVQVKKGLMYVRMDDGAAAAQTVLQTLRLAERAFGSSRNGKGYRVLNNAVVLLADGDALATVQSVLQAAMEAGFSAQNVAFGLGAGLLHVMNRDTMSFATKLNFIEYADGQVRDVMKKPTSDSGKISFPGYLAVYRDTRGIPMVYPSDPYQPPEPRDLLTTVYDHGPVRRVWEDLDAVRARVAQQWAALPPRGDPISVPLMEKIRAHLEAGM